jgi:hypothetical protein
MATQSRSRTEAVAAFLFPELELQDVTPEVRAHVDAIDEVAHELVKRCQTFRERFPNVEAGEKPNPTRARILKFDECHRKKFNGTPAHITQPKDNALMKKIVDRYGEAETDDMIAYFFGMRDEWVESHGYTVGFFSQQVPAIIARMKRPTRATGVTRNTQGNSENSAIAAGMIRKAYGP